MLELSRRFIISEIVLTLPDGLAQEAKANGLLTPEFAASLFRAELRRRDPNKIVQNDQTTVVLHLDEKTFTYFKHAAETSNVKTVESEIRAELRTIAEKEVGPRYAGHRSAGKNVI